jgi:hypothetical protein
VRFAAQRRSGLRSFPQPTPTASPGLRLEHRLLQLGLCQKLFDAGVLPLQLSQPFSFLSMHPVVLLLPAVVGWLRDLNRPADVGDSLALSDQLLNDFELADDLLSCVVDSLHGGVPGPVWPDEDSHSPWTSF